MALAFLIELPGGKQEQFDQVWEKLQIDEKSVPGLLFHAEGPVEGGWRTVDVWESQEAADKFFQERLGQALQEAGVTETLQQQIQVWPVHHMLAS